MLSRCTCLSALVWLLAACSGDEPRSVTIDLSVDYVAPDGTTSSAPYAADVELLVPDGSGALTSLYTNPSASGSVTVPDVPAGEYVLRVGTNYLLTSAEMVDLGYSQFGRSDVPFATTSPTTLSISVTNMTSWAADDSLELAWPVSGGNMLFEMQWYASSGAPQPGATSLSGLAVDLAPWSAPLIDTTSGDQAVLLHLGDRVGVGSHPYRALIETADLAPLTLGDGQSSTVSGSFDPVSLNESIGLDVRGTEFAALLPDVGPNATEYFPPSVFLVTLPRITELGAYDHQPDLMSVEVSSDSDVAEQFAYGNPFAWDELAIVDYFYRKDYALPGASPVTIVAGYQEELTATEAGSRVLRPSWKPIDDLRIEGMNAQSDVAGVGLTPVLSWSPPSSGSPDSYFVSIYELGVTAGTTSSTFIAGLLTGSTSVRVPEGILRSGGAYVFVVGARFGTQVHAPFRRAVPGGFISSYSGIIRP